jgi:toxin ParE1/3/4
LTPKPVVARGLARRDLEEATRYYRIEASVDVSLRFVAAVRQANAHICLHPKSGSLRYAEILGLPGLRYWPLKRFPYLIFYVELADRTEIWRVLHAGSDLAERWSEPNLDALP